MTRGKGEASVKAWRQERWRICWEGRRLQLDQKAGLVITLSQGDRKPLEAVSQGMTLSDVSWTSLPGGRCSMDREGKGTREDTEASMDQ